MLKQIQCNFHIKNLCTFDTNERDRMKKKNNVARHDTNNMNNKQGLYLAGPPRIYYTKIPYEHMNKERTKNKKCAPLVSLLITTAIRFY